MFSINGAMFSVNGNGDMIVLMVLCLVLMVLRLM